MSGKKPRVWLKPSPGFPCSYTRLSADAIADTLTAKEVLEFAHPDLPGDFFHVYFMGTTQPREDSYGVAAFSDDENLLGHAPGANDIYLLVECAPLTSAEMSLALKDDGSAVHLQARPPCASTAPKVQAGQTQGLRRLRCRSSITEPLTTTVTRRDMLPDDSLGGAEDASVRGSTSRASKPGIKID